MQTDFVRVRASSLSTLFDCPAAWAARHLDNKPMASSSKALIGNAVHHSAAVYDVSKLQETGITINDAADAAMDYVQNPPFEVDWADDSKRDAERTVMKLHQAYCTQIAPKMDYVAIESTCDGISFSDLRITLTGTTDRIYSRFLGGYGILDVKTGAAVINKDQFIDTGPHIAQMGVYELLAEQTNDITIDEPALIAGMSTSVKEPRVGLSQPINGAKRLLLGNPDEGEKGILAIAADIIHSGNFYGNPRSMICHKQYCPNFYTCKFRGQS